jgi:hypothetical protein
VSLVTLPGAGGGGLGGVTCPGLSGALGGGGGRAAAATVVVVVVVTVAVPVCTFGAGRADVVAGRVVVATDVVAGRVVVVAVRVVVVVRVDVVP